MASWMCQDECAKAKDDQRWFILSWMARKNFLCTHHIKGVPSSWYQFTHVWSISVISQGDERHFFHYNWHQWHPRAWAAAARGSLTSTWDFLLIVNVNQFLSRDQSQACSRGFNFWWASATKWGHGWAGFSSAPSLIQVKRMSTIVTFQCKTIKYVFC